MAAIQVSCGDAARRGYWTLAVQVCMTGYMFRNVQYRLELRDALGSMAPAAATTASAQNSQLDAYSSSAAMQGYHTMEPQSVSTSAQQCAGH